MSGRSAELAVVPRRTAVIPFLKAGQTDMIVWMETENSLVEDAYRAAVDAMTPAQKFARMHAFLHWVRDLYARQLREELGDIPDERLKWEVCLRLYCGDRRARELIEGKLRDVQS